MIKKIADNKEEDAGLKAINQTNVGVFYLNCIGVEKSVSEAKTYLEKAAETGEENAKDILVELETNSPNGLKFNK